MTATFNLDRSDVFPVGTEVGAYPVVGAQPRPYPGGSDAPVATATDTDTVDADGILHFTGLVETSRYVAAAQVGGVWRRVYFRTPTGAVTVAVGSTIVSNDAGDVTRWPTWRTRRRGLTLV